MTGPVNGSFQLKPRAREFTLHLRLMIGRDIRIGPGKANLLEGIEQTGSIAAAGRRMQMSYKRAWYLLDTLNQSFQEPLVQTRKGGRGAGGTTLTPMGKKVLALYRSIEARARRATDRELAALGELTRPVRAQTSPPTRHSS
jgi:molybdate transport system regulatory protein